MSLNSIGLLVFLFLNWHVAWFTISCFRCTAKWLFTHITHVYIWLFSDSFIGCYKILGIVLCAISRYLLATFVSFLASLHGMWDHSSLCVCVCVCVCVHPSHVCLCSHMKNHKVPLSVEYSRQKYWDGCRFLHQGFFLTQGSNVCLLHWQADSFTTAPPGKSP